MKKLLSFVIAIAFSLSCAGSAFAAPVDTSDLVHNIDVQLDAKIKNYESGYTDALSVTGNSTTMSTKVTLSMAAVKTAWNAYIAKGAEALESFYPDDDDAKEFILNNVPLVGNFTLTVKGESGLSLSKPEYSDVEWSEDAAKLFEKKSEINYNSATNTYTLEMKIRSGVDNHDLEAYFNNAGGLGEISLTTSCFASGNYAKYDIEAVFDGYIEGTGTAAQFVEDMRVNFHGADTPTIEFVSRGGSESGSGPVDKPTPTPTPTPTVGPTGPATTVEPQLGGTANGAKLNYVDHYAYIIGYDDQYGKDEVRPENPITRAEVATIFYRLLDDESREKFRTQENDFSDVNVGDWYNNNISTVAAAGIVNGYDDGTFQPNKRITRAEFATIASRFTTLVHEGEHLFTDIDGHWAAEAINNAAITGWVNGYDDGSFKPEAEITRAEAITLINRVLYRYVLEEELHEDLIEWKDNTPDKWYYTSVQEATNSHDYDREEIGHYETHTAISDPYDWESHEK